MKNYIFFLTRCLHFTASVAPNLLHCQIRRSMKFSREVGGVYSILWTAPEPTGGAYNAPPDSVVGWGGDTPSPFLTLSTSCSLRLRRFASRRLDPDPQADRLDTGLILSVNSGSCGQAVFENTWAYFTFFRFRKTWLFTSFWGDVWKSRKKLLTNDQDNDELRLLRLQERLVVQCLLQIAP